MAPKKKLYEEPELRLISIGRRFREVRNFNRVTLDEAAAKIGTVRQTFAMIEAGKRAPHLDETRILAKFYGTSVEWLLNGTGQMIV